MSDVQQVLDALKGVQDTQTKLEGRLDDLQKANEQYRTQGPWGAPAVRKGEDPLSSRPYSFLKAFGLLSGQVEKDNAKTEVEVSEKLRNYYNSYGFKKSLVNSVFLPFWADALTGDARVAQEIGEVVRAGNCTVHPEDVQAARRQLAAMGYTRALSWIDETSGGSLVAPPAMGELIDVLRNNEVLMAAGARVLPMPPQGRITFPRQTSAATAYHVGESVNLTESQQGTGDVVLQAKKLTILNKIPNELFHFAAIPIEAFVREDMMRVIALKMDKTLLEDPGSSTTPRGLITYANITGYTSLGTPADGNSGYPVHPADPTNMVGNVEEKNATFRAFIMRPLLWATLVNRRADAVTAGDRQGPFMFNILRDPGMDLNVDRLRVGVLNGYPVYKTTQLSTTRTRGSGTTNNTYVLGGDFSDFLIAMGGALEFQVSTQGDTPFVADQTWFKGVMYYDGAPRHEASFCLMDNVLQNT